MLSLTCDSFHPTIDTPFLFAKAVTKYWTFVVPPPAHTVVPQPPMQWGLQARPRKDGWTITAEPSERNLVPIERRLQRFSFSVSTPLSPVKTEQADSPRQKRILPSSSAQQPAGNSPLASSFVRNKYLPFKPPCLGFVVVAMATRITQDNIMTAPQQPLIKNSRLAIFLSFLL